MTVEHETGPALSVCGVNRKHADRAIKWLRARSLAAFYNSNERSLCAFEFRPGREWTYDALNKALKEARK